jgi:hypothetical protein
VLGYFVRDRRLDPQTVGGANAQEQASWVLSGGNQQVDMKPCRD